MAGKVYFGVANLARKMKSLYLGVGGVARKVKKIYIGVSGVARLVWQAFVTGLNIVTPTGGTFYVKPYDGMEACKVNTDKITIAYRVPVDGGSSYHINTTYVTVNSDNTLTTTGSVVEWSNKPSILSAFSPYTNMMIVAYIASTGNSYVRYMPFGGQSTTFALSDSSFIAGTPLSSTHFLVSVGSYFNISLYQASGFVQLASSSRGGGADGFASDMIALDSKTAIALSYEAIHSSTYHYLVPVLVNETNTGFIDPPANRYTAIVTSGTYGEARLMTVSGDYFVLAVKNNMIIQLKLMKYNRSDNTISTIVQDTSYTMSVTHESYLKIVELLKLDDNSGLLIIRINDTDTYKAKLFNFSESTIGYQEAIDYTLKTPTAPGYHAFVNASANKVFAIYAGDNTRQLLTW